LCVGGVQRIVPGQQSGRVVMTKWRCILVIALAMVVSAATSTMAGTDSLSDFVETYQCSLQGLIAKILARDTRVEHGRFVVLSLADPAANYVQCHFGERDREALCEASSGWFNRHGEKRHFTPIQLHALQKLGFSTDGSHGNFQRHIHFASYGPEPYALAGMMLSALYEGYDARKDLPIEVVAPFALRHGYLPRERCVPIS